MHLLFSMCQVLPTPLHELGYLLIITSIQEKYYCFTFTDHKTETQSSCLPKVSQLLISSGEITVGHAKLRGHAPPSPLTLCKVESTILGRSFCP